MKRLLLFFSLIVLSVDLFAQPPITFSELGSHPAYCRTSSTQAGNGVVYCSASGGTPDFSYKWTNLSTGATSINTSWGGLNPGLYKIVVTDDAGDSLVQIVEVDSINPVANFHETLGNLNPAPFGYTGYFYENAKFVNTSTGFSNPYDPYADTTFLWYTGIGAGEVSYDINYGPTVGYPAGDYDFSLVVINNNGCADTLAKHIHIFGPVGIEDDSKTESFISIYSKPQQNSLHFNCAGFSENMLVTIFSISGEAIMMFEAIDGNNEVVFNVAKGVYAYTVVGAASQNIIATGKLNY